MKSKKLTSLLETKMSRKDFLLFLSSLLITILGITQFGDTVSNVLQSKSKNIISSPSGGFSSGTYGGYKKS